MKTIKKSILFFLTVILSIALFGCSNKETVQDSKTAQSKQKFIIVDSQSPSATQKDGYQRSSGVGKESSGPGYIPNFKGVPIHLLPLKINGTVYANSNDKTHTIEEFYTNLGFVSVGEAVKKFEEHFGQNLELPLRVPPIPFTHVFGRFNDLEGEQNDSFEMEFINEESSGYHFFIVVRTAKYGMKINDRDVVKTYKLKNGEKATYMNIRGANLLVFERGNFHYLFSANEKISKKVTPEILVQIANSIDYSTK